MLMLTLVSLAAAGFIILVAILPMRCRWWWKIIPAALAVAVALYFKMIRVLGGPLPFAPDLPGWFLLLTSWIYMTMMAYFIGLAVLQLIRWLIVWPMPAWRKIPKETRRSRWNSIHLILLGLVAILCATGEYNAMKLPRVKHVTLQLPVREPLRIALLADLHADVLKKQDFMRGVVEITNAQHPDLVAIVGDFTDGTVERNGESLKPLQELQAPLGVYGVPGNHEYFSGYEPWRTFLNSLGVRMLNNEHETLAKHGVVLAGVTDPAAKLYDMEPPNARKALSSIPADAETIILLAHQPQLVKQAEPLGVTLQLSGHTHGGLTPGLAEITAAYNNGFVNGLYRTGNMWLYVSPGSSLWSGTPLRLGVPAEITIITITPAPAQTEHSPDPAHER